MFDISWQELFLIAVLTIVVIGPKELPRALRAITIWSRKIRAAAREFQQGLDDLAREAELDELRRELKQATQVDLDRELEKAVDPDGTIRDTAREIGEPLDAVEKTGEEAKKALSGPVEPSGASADNEQVETKKMGGAS